MIGKLGTESTRQISENIPSSIGPSRSGTNYLEKL
jgi:hypothetical protein